MNFWIFPLICSIIQTSFSSKNISESPSDTLEFVNQAQNKLKLANNSNITLVIGNTGSGKSTLVHYIAGDFSKLISIRPANPNALQYGIHDGLDSESGNITSSTVSRTFVPEKLIDEEQNVWYDCPGFADTRNESVEIATTFLIKSIIESAVNVRFVLVAEYGSVTEGYNRHEFDDLLTHTIRLLKKVKPFENSVSLVVSKVPPRGFEYVEIYENNVKNTSAQFLRDYRSVLLEKGSNEKKILLIDALLKGSNDFDNYPRISIFWRPDRVGPFDKIPKLVTGRHLIRQSIIQHTVHTRIQSDDFGFPLSNGARLHIKSMADQVCDSITTKLHNISAQLQREMREKISAERNYDKMFDRIEMGLYRLQYYSRDEQFLLKNLTSRFRGVIKGSDLKSIDTEEFIKLELDEKNLNIFDSLLENANNNVQPKIDYKSFLNEFKEFFHKSEIEIKADVANDAQQTINNISMAITDIDRRLFEELQGKMEQIKGFQGKLELLNRCKDSIKQINEVTTLDQRMKQFSKLNQILNVTSIDSTELNQYLLHLRDLVSIPKISISVPVRDWIANSSAAIDFLSSEFRWHSFLSHTYDFLSGYDVQKNVDAYNVTRLSDWGVPNRPQGLKISETNFNDFIRCISPLNQFTATSKKLNDLNEIIHVTLKSPLQYEYVNPILTIKGHFVKSSDIQLYKYQRTMNLEQIRVFVTGTFYVDSDLNGWSGIELHILATKWNILKESTFYLNGNDGSSLEQLRWSSTPGRPGNPGTNSGNFFGVANEMVNGNLLTIELKGGDGGDGQDGTGSDDIKPTFYPDRIHVVLTSEDIEKKSISDRILEYIDQHSNGIVNMVNTNNDKKFDFVVAVEDAVYKYQIKPIQRCSVSGKGGTGGKGGYSGYYHFISKESSENNLPIVIKRKGSNGDDGDDGRNCKLYRIDVDADTNIVRIIGLLYVQDTTFTTQLYSFDENREQRVSSISPIFPSLPKNLNITSTLTGYKQMLQEILINFPLISDIIQTTLNLIDFES